MKPDYVVDERGCWIWQKAYYHTGYPVVNRQGFRGHAHRLYYEERNGPIAAGLVVDHLCRTPACVNPDHLEAVTQAVNTRRGMAAKLTWDDVLAIRQSSQTYQALAEKFGVSIWTVGEVRRRNPRRWRSPER